MRGTQDGPLLNTDPQGGHVRNMRSKLVTGAAVGAAAVGGAAIANATSSTTTQSAPSSSPPRPAFNGPPHGSAAHEGAEKAVTGAAATKAKAAAVNAAGGGTATEVTTDFMGHGYEVAVKKSDDSTVEIHLDNSFKVVRGFGGHGGPGRFGGPPPG